MRHTRLREPSNPRTSNARGRGRRPRRSPVPSTADSMSGSANSQRRTSFGRSPSLPPSGEKGGARLASASSTAYPLPSGHGRGVCGAGGPRTWASRRPGASSASKAEQLPLLSTGTPLVLRGGCAGAGPPLLPSMAGGAPAPRGTDKGSAIPWCPVGLQSCKARPGALGVRPAAGVSGGRERARVGVRVGGARAGGRVQGGV